LAGCRAKGSQAERLRRRRARRRSSARRVRRRAERFTGALRGRGPGG